MKNLRMRIFFYAYLSHYRNQKEIMAETSRPCKTDSDLTLRIYTN